MFYHADATSCMPLPGGEAQPDDHPWRTTTGGNLVPGWDRSRCSACGVLIFFPQLITADPRRLNDTRPASVYPSYTSLAEGS